MLMRFCLAVAQASMQGDESEDESLADEDMDDEAHSDASPAAAKTKTPASRAKVRPGLATQIVYPLNNTCSLGGCALKPAGSAGPSLRQLSGLKGS